MTNKEDLSEDQYEDIMNEARRLYKEYQNSMAGKVTAQYCRKEDQFEYWVMIATQTALQAENKRLRKALEFYAKGDWQEGGGVMGDDLELTFETDYGQVAKQALKESGGS